MKEFFAPKKASLAKKVLMQIVEEEGSELKSLHCVDAKGREKTIYFYKIAPMKEKPLWLPELQKYLRKQRRIRYQV